MDEEFTEIEESAFKAFKNDFKNAVKAKNKGIDELISEWNDLYYGKTKEVSGKARSKMVMKEIAKQIEFQKPNITEPFLSTSHPVRVTRTGINALSGRPIQNWLNSHFTSSFNRDDFINQLVDVLLREGTVWIRTGWKSESNRLIMTMEEIVSREDEPIEISERDDGKFNVVYGTTVNEPTARVCRNEHVFPDPGAKTIDELRFLGEKRLQTVSELRESKLYSEDVIDQIVKKLKDKNNSSGALEHQRDSDGEDYGQTVDYQTDDDPRKKVSIIEMWGYYDLNDDGIAEPVLVTWAENEDVNMRVEDNPLPSQNIPFHNSVYSARPFSLWGNALAYFIGDNQKVKTGIVRGIMDNMSLANNGQKFVQRGTLDYINFKRMRNGERHIIVNKKDGIQDGTFNNLPTSVFQTLAMFSKESEDITGVSSGSPALSNDSLAKDDNGGTQLTMAQQRMASTVRSVSNLIVKMMKDWVTMGEVFLENDQIEELFSEQEQVNYHLFKNSKNSKLSMKVGTDINRTVKMQQLNMLLQQSKQLGESVPKDTFNSLVAEMFELFDMYDKAEELRNYKPQPSPEQQRMQQLKIQEAELKVQEIQISIQERLAKIEIDKMKAQTDLLDAQATNAYKQAQTDEKYAKADSHRVATAMKPAETISNIQQQQQQTNERRTI